MFGLNTNKFFNRSNASYEAPGKNEEKDFFLGILVLEIILAAKGDYIDYISFWDGLPINYKILYIWFKVEFPGKIDLPFINSPSIHPTDHISTALEYFVEPSKIYGALYHLVATYSVKLGSPTSLGQFKERANPKSATFAWHSEFRSRLLGLRSLWISYPECIYFNAFKSWYTINFLWISYKIPALMTTCKSVYIKSKTR